MIKSSSMRQKALIPITTLFVFITVLAFLNLKIGLQVLLDPLPFPSSHWDVPWAVLFATAFLSVGFLFLISKYKILITFALIGISVLIILPVFTIGVGAAYLMLLLLVFIARGAGEYILHKLLGKTPQDGLEQLVLAILLGFGLIMFLVMIQGALFAFTSLVTWLGIGLLTALFVLPNLKHWLLEVKQISFGLHRRWSNNQLSGWALAVGILAVLWIPSWLIALSPANRYDEMTYHLTAPLLYLHKGGIVPYPEGGATVWMHYAEMLYTLAMQTAGQPLPRLLHLMMGALSVMLIFLFGRRLVNVRVGAVASILFFAVPIIGYETATAYIDLFVTAYTTAVGLVLLIGWQENNPRWLLVAGILGGLGLGVKLTAGLMIAGLAFVLILAVLIKRRLSNNLPWIFAMLGLILVLALPWLVRDALWTGDPFYPYGIMFFHKMTAAMGTAQAGAANGQPSILETVRLFLRYPFDLVFNSTLYYSEATGGMASALPLLAVPLFIFAPSLSRSAKVVGLSMLAASVVTVGVMFFTHVAVIRYALPTFAWLAIGASLNIEELYCWLADKRSRWGITAIFLIVLLYAFSTRLPLIVRLSDNLPQRLPVNYILGRESFDHYLSRNLVVYDAFQFIDSQPNGPHRVLSIGNEFRLYTQSRIDGIYDVAEANKMVSTAQTPAGLAQSLAQSGYDYILINQPEVDFRLWKYSDPYPILKNSDFINAYSQLVFIEKGVYVYRFEPSGMRLPPAQNLLANQGFEDVVGNNEVANWERFGAVEVSKSAHQGHNALLLHAPLSADGASYVYQRVPVEADQFYTLGYWLKSDQQAIFLMQVRWLDAEGNVIAKEETWKNVFPGWHWYNLFSQSPQNARFAEVYASPGGSENILVDGVCLAVGQRCPNP